MANAVDSRSLLDRLKASVSSYLEPGPIQPMLRDHERGSLEDFGDRVSAGMDSQIYGLKDDGSYGYTAHPGIVDSVASLPAVIPPILRLIGAANKAAGSPVDVYGKIADYAEHHMPDFVNKASTRQSDLVDAIHNHQGLPDPQGFQQHAGEALGMMMTQLPIPTGPVKSTGTLSRALGAIPEYLGPTIRPSVGNYLTGAIAGGVLPDIPDYIDSTRKVINDHMPAKWAAGGAVPDYGHTYDPSMSPEQLHNQLDTPPQRVQLTDPTVHTAAPPEFNRIGAPMSQSWYETYGYGPEHDFGFSHPAAPATISGYTNNTNNPSTPPLSTGSGISLLGGLAAANKLYNTGSNLYKTGSNIYDKLSGNNGPTSMNPGSTEVTNTGTTANGSQYQGSSQGGVNSQASNPSSGGSGSGSLGDLVSGVGSGIASGTIGSTLGASTLPQGVVEIGEVGDTTLPEIAGGGAGSGALDAGIASGLSDAAASTAVQEGGSGAIGELSGSVGLGSTLGAVGAIAAMLNSMFGQEAYGSHSISGGAPLPGQKVVSLPGSPQTALSAGDLARGYGNDASQGSGQWFYTGDTKGADGWLGRADTEELTGGLREYLGAIQSIEDANKNNGITQNSDGTYSTAWTAGNAANLPGVPMDSTGNGALPGIQQRYVVNPDLSISQQEQFSDPNANTSIIDNPNPGSFGGSHVWAANDPSSGNITYNPAAADYFANPDWGTHNIDLHDIYNQYGGQSGNDKYGGWGTDYNTWLSNALGIAGNMSGEESGSYTGHADGGQIALNALTSKYR